MTVFFEFSLCIIFQIHCVYLQSDPNIASESYKRMDRWIRDEDLIHDTFSYRTYTTPVPIDAIAYYHRVMSKDP